jgi:hypothetical protein
VGELGAIAHRAPRTRRVSYGLPGRWIVVMQRIQQTTVHSDREQVALFFKRKSRLTKLESVQRRNFFVIA